MDLHYAMWGQAKAGSPPYKSLSPYVTVGLVQSLL